MNANAIVGIWLIANLAAVGIFDLCSGLAGNPTVSQVIIAWSKQWPALPLGVGLLIGHLFLQ